MTPRTRAVRTSSAVAARYPGGSHDGASVSNPARRSATSAVRPSSTTPPDHRCTRHLLGSGKAWIGSEAASRSSLASGRLVATSTSPFVVCRARRRPSDEVAGSYSAGRPPGSRMCWANRPTPKGLRSVHPVTRVTVAQARPFAYAISVSRYGRASVGGRSP